MKTLATLAVAAVLSVPAAAQTPAAAPDAIGTWSVTVNTAQGPIPSTLKLTRNADKIVGTIASDMGQANVEAEQKDAKVSVWFDFPGQNGTMAIEMTGTVAGDSIKGSISGDGQVIGDWVASRVKDASAPAKADMPAASAPTASAPAATSLTGTWNVALQLPDMSASPTIELKQDGEKLTGNYISGQYGKFPLEGTVKGDKVEFWFSMSIEGTSMNASYAGTLQKDGTLKGTVNYGDMMNGTFVAAKK